MIIMLIFFFMMISVLMLFFSMVFLFNKMVIMMEFILMEVNSMNLSFIIYLDWVSLMFIGLVLFISSFILMYSLVYMEGDLNIIRFFFILLMFVLSMIFLIICPNLLGLLLGWDGLGLTSYCLVIYYQNWNSFNCGMVTVLLNRIGDVGILMMICMMISLGSWNGVLYDFDSILFFLLMLLSAMTKSAQLPFSIWLPMAMAAPTPVSSLVHSSTLVTAGVYLLMRYNYLLLFNNITPILLLVSSSTMLMSGLMANFENDLKKIIALSTLSQLGLMMSILSLGKVDLGFFHLFIHALFKSLLFMCSGVFIHQMLNNQDIRFMGNLINYYPLVSIIFFVSSLSLCGFPFFSGYYSKDLIMEVLLMSKMNYLSLLMLLLSTLFTVSYSIRLLILVYFNYYNKFNMFSLLKESNLMSISMVILYLCSLLIGFFLMNLFTLENIIMNLLEKTLVLQICFMGVFLGWFFSFKNLINKSNFLKFYLSKMWGLNMVYEKLNFYPLKFSLFIYKLFDKGVLEYSFVYGLEKWGLNEFLKFFNFKIFIYINLISMFFFIFLFLILFN
uniref:NADH-ubiquinone oxidoreductase chain 5 n=1 Tax=Parapolybia crocea TaxID=2051043 RepID=A0A2D1WBF0_9HYME|nr:NADH dehydrogenase subunit 5 [Parapolybia crocea]ATP85020.1 NADH dehydrogenase subunit 5 [Parapolybia crocea]